MNYYSNHYFDDRFALIQLVEEYEQRTEAFDRTVCTGPIRNGSIMPANGKESSLICHHARQVNNELLQKAIGMGYSSEDFCKMLRSRK